jgi:ABC-type lipoprotein export system ATPase subunit
LIVVTHSQELADSFPRTFVLDDGSLHAPPDANSTDRRAAPQTPAAER